MIRALFLALLAWGAPAAERNSGSAEGRSGSALDRAPGAEAGDKDPWAEAYSTLEKAVGAEAVDVLARQEIVVVTPSKKGRRLLLADWEALESLGRHAKALAELSAQAERFKSKTEVPAVEDGLKGVLGLPSIGPFTPGARAAAAILAEARVHKQALGLRFGTFDRKPLWRWSWARPFDARFHAAALEDPSPLLQPYFDLVLAGPEGAAAAADHLTTYILDAYKTDISKIAARDLAARELSGELRGWLLKYLHDQRRLLRLERLAEALTSLYRRHDLRRELDDLASAAAGLAKAPGLAAALRPRLNAPEAPCSVCLRTAEAHLHSPPSGLPADYSRQGAAKRSYTLPQVRHELGDKVEISAAYWVDGLPEGESAEVTEVWLQDRGPEGFQAVTARSASRRNGGPYTTSAEARLADASPFSWRLILSVPQAPPARLAAEVAPGRGVADALKALAHADSELLSCRLAQARGTYEALDKDWSGKAHKRYKELRQSLRSRRKRAQDSLRGLEALKGLMPLVRSDASPEACAFRTDRAERARRLLAELPAGCAKDALGEADDLLLAAGRRRAAQDAFDKAVEAAREAESSCRLPEAPGLFSSALAFLDAEPAARCGRWERAHARIREQELPRAAAAAALPAHVEEGLGAARKAAPADPRAVLETLVPLASRIDASPDARCHAGLRRQVELLASAAGTALSDDSRGLAQLPPDSADAVIAEISANKQRLDRNFAEQEARRKEARSAMLAAEGLMGIGPSPAANASPDARPGRSGSALDPAPASDAPAPPAAKAKTASRPRKKKQRGGGR